MRGEDCHLGEYSRWGSEMRLNPHETDNERHAVRG
jgi:hypothetical protein